MPKTKTATASAKRRRRSIASLASRATAHNDNVEAERKKNGSAVLIGAQVSPIAEQLASFAGNGINAQRAVDEAIESHKNSSSPAPRSDVTLRASFVGVFGAPECGKSTVIKKLLSDLSAPHLIIFDPGHEYDIAPADTDELAFYTALNAGRAWATFRPSFDIDKRARQFDRFCSAGLSIARARGSCAIVVDELHLVTDAGNAPAHWRELIETGRKFGISAIAASIRPASIDKGFWTAATMIRTGRLNYTEDQKTLANVLNVPVADVAALAGFDWIQRDMRTGAVTRSADA